MHLNKQFVHGHQLHNHFQTFVPSSSTLVAGRVVGTHFPCWWQHQHQHQLQALQQHQSRHWGSLIVSNSTMKGEMHNASTLPQATPTAAAEVAAARADWDVTMAGQARFVCWM
jgi:hypothetical protein